MTCRTLWVRAGWVFSVLLTAFIPVASAQSLTNLAGTWNNLLFSTPSRLTLQRDWVSNPLVEGAHLLREIDEKEFFETGTGQIVAQPDGSFTGMATGTFSLPGGGRMVVSGEGFSPITFYMNAACDFMYSLKRAHDAAIQDLELLLKAPASMTGAEMAGTWKSVSLGTPSRLVLERETLTRTYVTNVAGADEFDVGTGTVTVNANGTLTVTDNNGMMPGTYSPAGPGVVDVTMMEAFTIRFFVNASKNIMAGLNPAFPERNELILLVKQPANSVTAEFKGLWWAGGFVTPAQLTLVRTNHGLVTDIPDRYGFGFDLSTVTVGHNGAFTVPFEPASGLATLIGPGTVQAVVTNAFGEINADTLWANAAKDVMVTVNAEEGHELLLMTRAPAKSVRRESLGMVLLGSTIFWASDTNRQLQASTNLEHWRAITNTLGQSSHALNPAAATNGFFRVMESP